MERRIRSFFKRGLRNHFNWNLIREGFYSPPTSPRLQVFLTLLDFSHAFFKIGFRCSYFYPLFHRSVCQSSCKSTPFCSSACSPLHLCQQVWREKRTNEDLTTSSPAEKLNKYTDPLDTGCILFHTEMHKPADHLFTLKVYCRLSALQLLIKGRLRTLKHVKISSSADAGLLPAAPSTNAIFSLKKNERIRS